MMWYYLLAVTYMHFSSSVYDYISTSLCHCFASLLYNLEKLLRKLSHVCGGEIDEKEKELVKKLNLDLECKDQTFEEMANEAANLYALFLMSICVPSWFPNVLT